MSSFGRMPLVQWFGVIICLSTFFVISDAFTMNHINGNFMLRRATEKSFFWSVPVSSSPTILLSSNTDEGTEQEASATGEGTSDAPVDDGAVTEITAASEPEASPKVDDPAIVALKEEIAKLELEVKSARRQLANINDEADEFTKTGYARKVAEMENMRRARSMLQSTNKYSATAAVLSEFLPAMDTLMSLREKYGDDEFGKMYNALPGAIKSGFTSMDCTEYEIAANEPFVASRMVVVASEPSDTVPKDCVIRTVVPGMELQGNMMRLAQVITSSGSGNAEVASETSA